jgi:Tol biopolymer transport system component
MTPSWSPDGTRLAYVDERGLWQQTLSGGAPVRLVPGNNLHSPSWSPDSKRIVYVNGNRFWIAGLVTFANIAPSSIWIVDVENGKTQALTDNTRLQVSPIFTPDSRSVLFVSNAGGTRDIYQVDVSASGRVIGEPRQVTVGLQPYSLSISADGSLIGYSVLFIRGNLWIANIGGDSTATVASARPLTSSNNAIEALALSHDGKWVTYDSDPAGNQDIYKLRIDGGDPIQLTTDKADDFSPRWSPDDSEIAFHAFRYGSRDIFVMDAEGRNQLRVTSAPSQEFIPDWSPEGKRLCFSADIDGAYEVYVISRETSGAWGEMRRMTNERGLRRQPCRWSPDGQLIAYVYGSRLRVVPSAGGEPRTLVDWSDRQDEIRASDWIDVSTLMFHTGGVGGQHAFWSASVKGGDPKLVARFSDRLAARRPDFATDGKRIVFVATTDEADVWVMTLKR